MSADQQPDEIDRFYSSYGAAFAARDLDALEALCEYPMALADAAGRRQITDRSFYADLIDRFGQSHWATTRIDRVQKLPMGRDGAILIMEYARLRADGSELPEQELPFPRGCVYFLRRRDDGWKIVGLADHLPG